VAALIDQFAAHDSPVELAVIEPGSGISSRLPRRAARFWWDAAAVGRAGRQSSAALLHVPQLSAPLRSPLPLVVTVHDVIPLTDPAYRQSRAMRAYLAVMCRTVRRARAVIVPSCYVAQEVAAALGISADRIAVVPMGVDRRFRPAEPEATLPEELAVLGIRGRYIFNIGGLDIRKNLPGLLEAFARFCSRAPEPFQLIIGGAPHSGNQRIFPPLEPEIERLRLADSVILTGIVDEKTKLRLYQHATIYVTPSLSEGFGMTALEAMACGTPTIASNRTSLPEVVGEGGLLVEPDPDSLAEAMHAVARDREYARSLREAAILRASRFSWERTAAETAAVYRTVVEPRPHPAS
jgi:glycosyltransferase involved in cell wall biosynthesis